MVLQQIPTVYIAVEGLIDEAIIRALLIRAKIDPAAICGKKGKGYLRSKIEGYNKSAKHIPWLVLIDLDKEADCAPVLRQSWLPYPSQNMYFRIAVRSVEAWLIADRDRLSKFLHIAKSRIPENPDTIDYPKRILINLARRSRNRAIREDMIPRSGSGCDEGPAYASRIMEFVFSRNGWRPDVASKNSDSLRRALHSIDILKKHR